jgi:hypothetical protein
MNMCVGEPMPLTELARDLPEPVGGWNVELERRGIPVVQDDVGRPSVDRKTAKALYAEHRERQEAAARYRAEIEQRLIAADEARRAAIPKGIPAGMVPEGISAAQLMMLSDPMPGARRETVVEHSLANPAGAIVYHVIEGQARGGES